MAKEEIGPIAGYTALVAVMGIMIILISVLALVVVNALRDSAWATVTVGLTVPIAMLMGVYLRYLRPGAVLETRDRPRLLIRLAVRGPVGGGTPALGPDVHARARTLAWAVMAYGFAASVMPVWLLLAPRDYLSAFVKIGVVLALAVGILLVLPPLQMPAVTQFVDGTGRSSPASSFPSCSSRSPAAPSPASTRSSPAARRPSCSRTKPTRGWSATAACSRSRWSPSWH
jgi:carbon starvation protein